MNLSDVKFQGLILAISLQVTFAFVTNSGKKFQSQ